jgi:cysteinyl-tRNA synthetase
MHSCGPTVYDYAHVGNFRAFLMYDVVKRWLLYCGYSVDHVCNLTDVDDKIIIKMLAENKSLRQVTEKYSKAFFDDLEVRERGRERESERLTHTHTHTLP